MIIISVQVAPLFGRDAGRPALFGLLIFGRAGKFDGPLVESGAACVVKG